MTPSHILFLLWNSTTLTMVWWQSVYLFVFRENSSVFISAQTERSLERTLKLVRSIIILNFIFVHSSPFTMHFTSRLRVLKCFKYEIAMCVLMLNSTLYLFAIFHKSIRMKSKRKMHRPNVRGKVNQRAGHVATCVIKKTIKNKLRHKNRLLPCLVQ